MRAWGSLLVLPLFVGVSVVLTLPLAFRFLTSIPSTHRLFDPGLQAFIIGWDWHALTHNPRGVFDAPIFHPERSTLAYMDHMLGETAVAVPVLLITNSVAGAYNFLVVLSFAASAWATYRLTRLLAVPPPGAWLCGFLFAFSPYRYANLDLLNQLQTQFLPLGLFFGVRYLQRRKFRDAVGIAVTIVAQVYFGWYYTFYLGLALLLLLLYASFDGLWHPPRRHLGPAAFVALGAAIVTFPVVWPYVLQRMRMPGFSRTLGEAALYSADVLDYVRWNSSSVLAEVLRLPTGQQSYWPGPVTVGLAAAGVAAILRGPRTVKVRTAASGILSQLVHSVRNHGMEGYFMLLGLTAFLLSLGPILQVDGHRTWIPLPYVLAHYLVPGFSGMRAPARLAALTLLSVVVLAGIGYRHLQAHTRPWNAMARRGFVGALFLTAVLSVWPHELPLLDLPRAETMPAVYRWLAAVPGSQPILELPVPASDRDENEAQALRQYLVLYHGKPRVGGISGFTSHQYRDFRTSIQEFPSREALYAMDRLGVKLIVIHYGDYSDSLRVVLHQQVLDERHLTPLATFGDDAVYELRSIDQSAGTVPTRE